MRQKKFFNKAQRLAMAIGAHDEYIVASRGTGKSEGVDARFILRNVWAMPGSTGALLSPSYSKAWANTLPAICHALSSWGYIQNIHYYVGRKAPKDAGFGQPKREPLQNAWQNCFHFFNGTVMVVLSFANSMSANSMSLDWVIGPEAKFLDYDKIKHEVNAANRGDRQYFDDCPWHHSCLYSTDMPTTKKGLWIMDKKNDMDPKHINYIRNLYTQIQQYKAQEQTHWRKQQIVSLEKDLAIARRYQRPLHPEPGKDREYTVYFGMFDIFDNMEIVGKDYIWQMYREQPPLIWQTAFLNKQLLKVANGFYSALVDAHFYIPPDNNNLENLGDNFKKLADSGCLGDGDLDFAKPLLVAFDANAAICTAVVGQKEGNKLKVLNAFWVKTPDKLPDLVKNIAHYYRHMMRREFVFFYDHTFTWTTGLTESSYADTIEQKFKDSGFTVSSIYIGQQPRYDWRHKEIDLALKQFLILFNVYHTEVLKVALEQTKVKVGKTGFEKDKAPEKLLDSPDNPDEYKTHITDAFDTLFVGCFHFYENFETAVNTTGFNFM